MLDARCLLLVAVCLMLDVSIEDCRPGEKDSDLNKIPFQRSVRQNFIPVRSSGPTGQHVRQVNDEWQNK